MIEQEKLSREEVLKKLDISDDTLSLYERELEINNEPASSGLENFTPEDLNTLEMLHKLSASGLTYNEIRLLSSFSELVKNVDIEGKDEIKNLLSLSPVYRLKQSLNLSRQELNMLKEKVKELEESLKKEMEYRASSKDPNGSLVLQKELEIKEKAIINLDRQLSETLSELALYKENKGIPVKGKKTKELYKNITEKDEEITKLKKTNQELTDEFEKTKEETNELTERLELMEDEISEMEQEVEERYQEQLNALRAQIEGLIESKQKEWESYYVQSNEQHRKELLTMQRKHEQEILRLKRKIKEQFDEIEEIKTIKNPFLGLLKIGQR